MKAKQTSHGGSNFLLNCSLDENWKTNTKTSQDKRKLCFLKLFIKNECLARVVALVNKSSGQWFCICQRKRRRVKVLLESNETEHWHNNCIYIDCHQYCDDHDHYYYHWIARKKGRWRCQIHRWQITSGASYKATSKGTLSPSYCQQHYVTTESWKKEPFLFSILLSILSRKISIARPLVTHDLTSMGTKKSGFISINDFVCSTIQEIKQ